MKKSVALASLALLASLAGIPHLSRAHAQSAADKKTIITQASESYYNLRSSGMSSFQCSVAPNWQLLLQEQRKQNAQSVDDEMPTLNQLHFTFAVDADDKMKLTHNDITGLTSDMAVSVNQIESGMEQMASGFFDTWSFYTLHRPLPGPADDFQLETMGSQYRISYKDGTADVITTLSHDYAMTNMAVTTPEFHSTVQPGFTRTPTGYLLNSYEANFQSSKPEEATQLKATIAYQDVEGFQILQKLDVNGTYGPNKFTVQLIFSACQVTKSPVTAKQ